MRIDRITPRGLTAALLISLAAVAPALSAQGVNRASTPNAINANATPIPPAPADDKTAPAAITFPLKPAGAPSAADEKAQLQPNAPAKSDAKAEAKTDAKDAAKPAEKALPHIALILPSNSKALSKVADAVKQGFLAGAMADGKNAPPLRIYPAEDEGASLTAQYRKAANDGAAAVVGGVTRDGATMLVKSAGQLPTLALNAPANLSDFELPERFFHISLNLDWEARLAARAAAGDGLRHVAVVASKSPLARRVQETFEREFVALGGEISGRIAIAGEADDGPRVAKAVADATGDCVFLAAEMKVARIARPYFPQGTPVFATSLTIDPRGDAVENVDVDSVRFMEMPWFVQADHPAVMAYARPQEAMPIEYERLYALGIDAWRLAQLIIAVETTKVVPALDGVTGHITLDGHQFVRMLSPVEMRDGRPVLFKPAAE